MRARDSPIFFHLKKGVQDKNTIEIANSVYQQTNRRKGMIRTKRILAMLLAVVLCFSTLPFSVSADEVSSALSTESTVESQPGESQAEETEEPAQTNGTITISDSSGDVPVVYAIDPYDEIKNKAEGGSNDMTQYGVTRAKIVSHLESHEHDDFYLGTPYQGGDWQSPNGDTSYNGSAGMNCTGFVSYVLRACGLDTGTFLEQLSITGSTIWAGSGLPYDLMSGASNYLNAVQNGDIAAYTFRDKSELLASGLAQKGDILLMWWSLSPFDDGADNHIGFFWGDSPSEDKMWHSSTHPQSGNQISEIVPKTPGSYFILIKTENEEPTYSVTLTKTSADVSITQGNSAYSLAGATYNVYKGTSGTGDVVATFTTDEAGHATLSTPLEDGTYSVKEVTPPKGYKLDEKIYTFTINGADTSLSVEDEPGTLTLKLKKEDSQTGSAPQGNATLAGAVYQVSYQLGGQTVTKELTSDSSGNLGTLEGIPFGTVTVKELTAPEGYRLDTEVHTYTVDGSQLTGDVYELEVDDLTEDVQRGGLTIQKLDSQTGTTPQGDASLEGISFEIVNQSQNPVVVNGNTAVPGQVAMTITTNAAGVATTGENALPYGDYTVREVSTNDSMLQTFTEEISVTIDSDGEMLEYEAENEVVRGGIDLEKQDSQMGTTPQGDSSFAGIDFEVINRSANPVVVGSTTYAVGDIVMTITTDESGHASTGSDVLPYGTYEVRESATNESMLLTWIGETVTVRQNGHSVTAVNDVERGGLSVEKQDSITGSTPQGDADFEGITFQIINNSRNPVMVEGQKYQPGEVVKTLVTDSEGKASTSDDLLPYGEYILRESATNESMLMTAPDQTVNVTDDGVIYEFVMADEVVRGGVLIEKRDLESGLLTPLGGASLDGTLFEITNKSVNAVYVNGALYQPGEVCATIEVVDGIAQTDTRALPYGTYQMVESKPGEGYLHTDQTVRSFQIRQDGQIIEFRDGDAAYNQVIRGDLQFVKVGEGGESNMHRFANVAFKLTSQTTGESHIVVTDENGEVRTTTEWNPHSQNTNGNDEITDETLWDDHAGTWFGLTTEDWMVDVQDELCALPYDTYTLEELPCEGNQGYELVKVPNITISRNNTTIYLGTVDDQFEGVPEIGTTATVDGEHTAEPAEEVTIVDTVTYKNLKVGQTYKLSGVLMDKETGEPLLVGEGEEQAQVTAEVEFTPTSPEGTVELTYTFNASALAGKSVVVFEDLYQEENVIASHADINDEGQTVTFGKPEIGTTATIDGEKTAVPAEQITITDTVEYSGLTVDQEYKLVGVLMDKETGEPLLLNDQQVTSEATFTPAESSGAIDVLFTFDASALTGKAVVVFETLFQSETEIASHEDIEDEGQTVTFTETPQIGTTATVDSQHTASPTGEITIVDVVEYTGLIPGEIYSVSGVLMDKATGEPLLVDGAEVTAEVEFTPESEDGTVELTYTLDASALAGITIVVFETLYQDDVEISTHADINDENQTVEITEPEKPTLGTTATVNGQHTADPTGEITIADVVEYTGLTPGKLYTISGVLMDKATGEPLLVDGAEVTAEVEFTPEAADGTVELTYTLDASTLVGTTIVVFETLYSDGVEIAAHADINDEAQTITINPKGGLLIQKTSEDSVLEGFTFLVESEGYSETFVTDGAGKIYIEDLAPGEYTITEQESELTTRYEIPAGQTVTVTAEEATTVEFYNRLLRGKITGHKTGAEQAPLEGVTFGLFSADATEFTEETAIATTETDSYGEFSFEAPYGSFQVMELATLPGYLTMKEPIAVEVNAAEVELEPIANNQTVVHVSKVDADTGEELPGATLELYGPDGSLIETWETSDIPHVITGLPVGEGYVLKETTAPEGYHLAEDITFAVEETSEIQFVGMVDEPSPEEPEDPDEPQTPDEPTEPEEPTPTVPQTGGSRAALWVGALFILALGGLGITLILLKKQNKL